MACGPSITPHLEGNAVALDVFLYGHESEEEVAIVEIDVAHGVVIFAGAFVKQLLVVDIARVYAEHIVQHLGRIHGVAHPVDVADIVFFALFHLKIHIDFAVVIFHHAVFHDACVAIAEFVILVDDPCLVVLIVGVYEFLFA